MVSINELKGMAQERAAFQGKAVTFALHSTGIPATHVIAMMADYLEKNEDHEAIRLVVQGKAFGYIPRERVMVCARADSEGVSSGDHGILLGMPDFHIVVLHCPTGGCNETARVLFYNRQYPVTCPKHGCLMVR
jgi:hypothetical protein